MTSSIYDVLIVGGGVSGTALLYELAEFTDLKHIALVEKYNQVASVNSFGRNNSQTIHCGDIETNYSLEKALTVKKAADMLVNYAKKQSNKETLVSIYPKMVLGVGEKECQFIRERFDVFKEHYPTMELWERDRIAEVEPRVVEGRTEEIVAMGVENDETAVDYQALSESFIENAKRVQDKTIDIKLGTEVKNITKVGDVYHVDTGASVLKAKFVVVSAGGHSLLLAQQMGFGKEFSCLPMAGSFYFTPQVLNGKVYTVQQDKLPFAAVHGDPDMLVPGKTRFGPTALLLPLLERYNKRTFFDFIKVLRLDGAVLKVLWDLFSDGVIRRYLIKNILFEVPFMRRRLFLKDVKKIIPNLELKDVSFAKGFGGVRPQLINKNTKTLMLGEAKINPGEGIVFNMTPSPGGTSCLANAYTDLCIIKDHLGCQFDEQAFNKVLMESV